jgi:hypothetical protein
MHADYKSTDGPVQPRPHRYRCAGCGCAVIAPPTAEPGDPCVCVACSPHVAGSPRMLELVHLVHARGLTLREAVESVGYGAVRH